MTDRIDVRIAHVLPINGDHYMPGKTTTIAVRTSRGSYACAKCGASLGVPCDDRALTATSREHYLRDHEMHV